MSAKPQIIPAIPTPFDCRGRPDSGALVAFAERLFADGADAINLLGTTGEATSLSVEERVGVMRAVAASGLDLTRVMVGTGVANSAEARLLTRLAHDLGFRAALVLPPYYYKDVSDEGLVGFLMEVVADVPAEARRIALYHFPQMTGISFTPEFVRAAHQRLGAGLVAIKDSSGDLSVSAAFVAAAPGVAVYPSAETVLPSAAASGFAGIISGTVNITVPLAVRLAEEACRGDSLDAVTKIRGELVRAGLIPAVKAVIAARLGDPTWRMTRAPLVALDEGRALAVSKAVAGLEEPVCAAEGRIS